MSQEQASRKDFLKVAGLSVAATILSNKTMAGVVKQEEILKLNDKQREFMLKYDKWMDEFIEVIKIQNQDRNNTENNLKREALSNQAEEWRPQLTVYMKDPTFSTIYQASIQRMKVEIL